MSLSSRIHPWVSVAVFEDEDAGKALEAFLREHGVEARTFNDRLLQLFLFLCPPRATFRVQVRKHAFKNATALLEAAPPDVLRKAIQCPSCRSLQINYPQMTRKFLLPTLLLHLGIIFRVIDHECYCEACHHIWNLAGSRTAVPKVRIVKTFPFNDAR
ncbi:MAG: hypothetical protein KGJ60_08000 [Verrucomicrobiota bacterium]|nr:hypothetical protein [Verrucomicrobiota bacterium]